MADRPLTHTQIDREVRRLLDGARLVCEVDWPDDLVFEVRKAWVSQRSYRPCDFIDQYPGIGVLFLVDYGIRNYEANEFWPPMKLVGAEQGRVGEAFERGLRTLGLETFPQFATPAEKARRFVAPILAHGGIPDSMAHAFLTEALFPALRRGHGSTGAEIVARWRRDPPPTLRSTVRRFLVNGGRTGVDLLDRLIDLARMPRADIVAGTATGVPAHLVRAFLAVPPAEIPSPRPILPRPVIELNPWSDGGPVVRLPPVVRELGEGLDWIVEDGSGATHTIRAYPRRDLDHLPLFPADAWRVAAVRGDDIIFDRTYECFGDNKTLCFDLAGAYLPDAEGIKADEAWIVTPADIRLASVEADGVRELAGETARFFGAWSRQCVMRVDLRGVDVLATLLVGKEVGRVEVLHAGGPKVEFTGPALADVHSQEGLDVRAALPGLVLPSKLAWTVRVTGPRGSATSAHPASDLPTTVDLGDLAGTPVLGTYDVGATGPLGFDFHRTFALVPGLSITTPKAPVAPGAGTIDVGVTTTCREIRFPGGGPGEPFTVSVAPDQSRAELWVFARDHAGKVGLFVSVPRIRWAFRTSDAMPEFGASPIVFEPADLGDPIASLLVSTGRPDIHVRLVLEGADGERIEVVRSVRSDAEGQFRADLAGIRDTARTLADGGLQLALYVGEQRMVVATHAAARKPAEVADDRSLFGREVTATVVATQSGSLLVEGDDWPGIVYEDRLPAALNTYRVGDEITGIVLSVGERVVLDARPFDPSAFAIGEIVSAKVVRARGDGLIVTARGHDLHVDPARLPPGRPANSWGRGDEMTGKVIYVNGASRMIRMSAAPFDPGTLRPGDDVEGTVFSAGSAILLSVGSLVGYIAPGNGPAGGAHSNQVIRGRLLRIDHDRDQLVITCRAFNASGHSPGDVMAAELTGKDERQAWVRLPGGESGWMSLEDALDADAIAALPVGAAFEVAITVVDERKNRICVRRVPRSRQSFGHDGTADSPFAALRAGSQP